MAIQIDVLDFIVGLDPAHWPQLTAGQADVLNLHKGSLAIDANQEVLFLDNGQLRSFDNTHRLVFDRANNLLDLHEQGAIRFLTGAPTPVERMCVQADGKVGIGTAAPTQALEVNGTVSATEFLRNGQALVSSPWAVQGADLNFQGKVGLGTTTPTHALHVAATEGLRQNSLFLSGAPGGSSFTYNAHRDAANTNWVFPDPSRQAVTLEMDDAGGRSRFQVWTTTEANKTGWIQRLAIDGETGATTLGGALTIGGGLTAAGSLSFHNSAGRSVSLGGPGGPQNNLKPNNVRLIMGAFRRILPGEPFTYEFAVGHTGLSFGGIGNPIGSIRFIKTFSVNEAGNLFAAGGKSGYVMDYFVNRVGDSLEQGDVVVIGEQSSTRYLGTNNNIPLPEVDLTDQAYDKRVCGIVAQLVTEADLPFVEPEPMSEEQMEAARAAVEQATAERGVSAGEFTVESDAETQPYEHPWREMAAPAGADLNRTAVADGQLGQMATLGAFAHCKVDADIAPIQVGDLLTTSPTRGHAQKVEDTARASGAILGKALAGLDKGKGKIPIMVSLS